MTSPRHGASSTDSAEQWRTVPFAILALTGVFGAVYSYRTLLGAVDPAGELSAHAAAGFGVTMALVLVSGVRTGPLADRHGPSRLLALAALGVAAGYALLALAPASPVVVLAFATALGAGAGMVYTPVVSTTGQRFERRRPLALGLTMTGVGVGTIVFPPAVACALDAAPWRAVTVAVGLLVSACLLAASRALRRPVPRGAGGLRTSSGPLPGRRERWPDPCFRLMYAAAIASGMCVVLPFVFLPESAIHGGASRVAAAALVSGIGVASTLARLLAGPVARAVGVLGGYAGGHVVIVASYVIWYLGGGHVALWCVALLFGTGYGVLLSTTPAALARVYGAGQLGRDLGLLYSASAPGALVAPAVAASLQEVVGARSSVAAFLAVALVSAGFAVAAAFVALARVRRVDGLPA